MLTTLQSARENLSSENEDSSHIFRSFTEENANSTNTFDSASLRRSNVNSISIFNRAIPYNTNKYNYWGVISFSFLSVALTVFPVSKSIRNMLYSGMVISLIGFSIMILIYPDSFYNHYSETIMDKARKIGLTRVVPVNQYTMNITAWLAHFIPVVVLRNKYTVVNPVKWILLYFLVFFPFLHKIYPFTITELVIIGISTFGIFFLFYTFSNLQRTF
jgi:hypothetical protein